MLNLSDSALLQPLLSSCHLSLSEYSFANIYLFRSKHSYEVVHGLDVYIKGKTYDGFTYLMPTSPKSFQALLSDSTVYSEVDFLFPIAEEWLQMVDASVWHATCDEGDSDYIFDVLHLSRYDGRGLSKKRNLVKQFIEQYRVQECAFDAQMALEVVDIWQKAAKDPYGLDADECRDAIRNMARLNLEGKLYTVDAKPVGILIGEALTNDTFVLHFAKADVTYKGIYQYMYQAFAKTLESRFAFINMEQDLGNPALRQAKHSYEPIRMARKIRLSLA